MSGPAIYVFPEDFGAKGDGVTDDWNAIQSAIGACSPSQEIYFSSNYGCSQPLTVNGKGIQAGGFATVTAVGAGVNGDCFVFPVQFGCRRMTLPKIAGFAGAAVNLGAGLMNIDCQWIDRCGAAILLGPGSEDCNIYVHFISNTTSCVRVRNPTVAAGQPQTFIQGTDVRVNFATTCKYGLDFDGSLAADSNSIHFAAWDSNQVPDSILWWNSGTNPAAQLCSSWTLSVDDWNGGYAFAEPPPAGTVNSLAAKGGFQFCKFGVAGIATWPDNWDLFQITTGGGNCFACNSSEGYANSFVANWQSASNNRKGFGPAAYMNTRVCKGQTIDHPAGSLFQTFVYTPFYDGNSFGYRAQPVVNPGFELVSITDNTAKVPGEVILTWRACQDVPIYSEFDFQFTSGLP